MAPTVRPHISSKKPLKGSVKFSAACIQ